MQPMAERGEEAVGSMGTDAALAVLSDKPQLLFRYFKQLFAQVTNPPIDAIREELVMELTTYVGPEQNLLAETPQHAHRLELEHPLLSNSQMEKIRHIARGHFKAHTIRCCSTLLYAIICASGSIRFARKQLMQLKKVILF
jgi:hypothetical protein